MQPARLKYHSFEVLHYSKVEKQSNEQTFLVVVFSSTRQLLHHSIKNSSTPFKKIPHFVLRNVVVHPTQQACLENVLLADNQKTSRKPLESLNELQFLQVGF